VTLDAASTARLDAWRLRFDAALSTSVRSLLVFAAVTPSVYSGPAWSLMAGAPRRTIPLPTTREAANVR